MAQIGWPNGGHRMPHGPADQRNTEICVLTWIKEAEAQLLCLSPIPVTGVVPLRSD